MKVSPWFDVWDFVLHGGPLTPVFGLLLLASCVLAAVNLARDPGQRSVSALWSWFARVSIGGLWWQQSLWKMPPSYGVAANGSGGLRFWMMEMIRDSSTALQSHLVANVLLPHFSFFAFQVYAGEVAVAVLLILGLFGRVSAIVGALMALNLWLGLYRSSSEWAWEYFFLLVIQVTFLQTRPGLCWGADALLQRLRLSKAAWLTRLT